jgi:hypothetical protein
VHRQRDEAIPPAAPQPPVKSNAEVYTSFARFVLSRNDRVVRLIAVLTVPLGMLIAALYYMKGDPWKWMQAALASLGVHLVYKVTAKMRARMNASRADVQTPANDDEGT